MGSLTKAFSTDSSKEQDGVWIDIAENDDKTMARMKIRRMGSSNKQYTKKMAAAQKKLRFARGERTALEMKAFREAFVETCLVDWENIENINDGFPGQPKETYMPLNQANAVKLFTSLPDLFDLVVGQATELETFQAEANEAEAKN